MFERFTSEARAVITQSAQQAHHLGHRYVGAEHMLLALVASDGPACDILRAHGLTPDRVESEIVGRVGQGVTAGLFGDLDREALATIGIDLDAVRARIEASFGTDDLIRAGYAVQGQAMYRPKAGLLRHLSPKRRSVSPQSASRRPANVDAAGRYRPGVRGGPQGPQGGAGSRGHLPFTLAAKKVLERSLRQAVALHVSYIGVEHIALALIEVDKGLVPAILSGAGVPVPALRAEILDRYRQAG
jgi:ATP-dependent Clp protease ATP-binding subunit ClpA